MKAYGLRYYESSRELAHGVKSCSGMAIMESSVILSNAVDEDCVLVPVPSHVGYATYTKSLCEMIAGLSKSSVADVLRCRNRELVYNAKKSLIEPSLLKLGIYTINDKKGLVTAEKRIILIDNVIDSGTTANQCAKAIIEDFGIMPEIISVGIVTEPKYKRENFEITYL